MSKRRSDISPSAGSATSGEFDMADFDQVIVHATSPSAAGAGNLVVEETLDAGVTWIGVGSVTTAIGTAVRLAVSGPMATRCRWRFLSGHGTQTRVQRIKSSL